MLPKTLKDAIATIDGFGYAGRVNIDAFPKLNRTMQDYQAGGMMGAIKIDMGQEPLELELTFLEINEAILGKFAEQKVDGILFRINGFQEADGIDASAVEIIARGRFTEMDMGGFKPKELTEFKVKADLTFYKYSVDGVEKIKIDLLNQILAVNGLDKNALRRALLKQ